MLSNQLFRILWLVMHLLCTILGHDLSNNCSTPLYFYPHDLGFTCLDFRVNHLRTYVSYIVFPIFLLHIWPPTFLLIWCYRPPGLQELRTATPTNPVFASTLSLPQNLPPTCEVLSTQNRLFHIHILNTAWLTYLNIKCFDLHS